MGIAFSFLPFLDACQKMGAIQSPLLAIGSLTLHESDEAIRSQAEENRYLSLEKERSVRALMRDRYGVADYVDCDLNGLADITIDFGQPLDARFRGRFNSILNGGTLEHVFDVRQAMANVHDLIRVGGSMIHLAPVTWMNHAFININPKMFRAIAEANGYAVLVEAFYAPRGAASPEASEYAVKFVTNMTDPSATEIEKTLLSGPCLPPNLLYMVAMQKNRDAGFNIPYDVTN
jgi:hypothetical protein